MSDGTVCLAYVHSNEVAHSWHQSVLDLVAWDMSHSGRVTRGGFIAMRCGSGGLVGARNKVAEQFLATDAEWLFVVDTDMGFRPDTVERLLDVADPERAPIVGALCFAQKETHRDGTSGFRCSPRATIIDWVETAQGRQFAGRAQWTPGSVVQCAATGMACVVIHRTVLQRMFDEHGPHWYDLIPTKDAPLGEDVSFCVRAGALGYPVFVHTGVRTTHLKQLWLSETDFWATAVAPPAAEKTAVIVPVLGRPQNAAPFMQSLRASTGLAAVYVMADAGDVETKQAWRDAGADKVLTGTLETFAKKVNAGARVSAEPWLFITGDDVRFAPGWLDHAQHAAKTQGAAVVGTNDLANPRVMSGDHGTHLLISRAYLDAVGASWDGPGTVCHEGYRHWYVDDEIVTVAKQRGVWTSALASHVQHLHPLFGGADDDDTYRLGRASADADRVLFLARRATHLAAQEATCTPR